MNKRTLIHNPRCHEIRYTESEDILENTFLDRKYLGRIILEKGPTLLMQRLQGRSLDARLLHKTRH